MNCSGNNSCPSQQLNFDKNFWNERWINQETAWDMQQVSPPLKDYFDTITNKNAAILIPGCGNAYEAQYLLDHHFTNITLIDIAPELTLQLQQKFGSNQNINIITDDFFKHQAKYHYIIEQTFFCALAPHLRTQYVQHMHQLLEPNGILAGVLFNTAFPNKELPPFGGNKEEYTTLFETHFNIKHMENCTNSIEPRKNKELFIELIKK